MYNVTELQILNQTRARSRAAREQPAPKTWKKQQLNPGRSLPRTPAALPPSGRCRDRRGFSPCPPRWQRRGRAAPGRSSALSRGRPAPHPGDARPTRPTRVRRRRAPAPPGAPEAAFQFPGWRVALAPTPRGEGAHPRAPPLRPRGGATLPSAGQRRSGTAPPPRCGLPPPSHPPAPRCAPQPPLERSPRAGR